MLDGLLKLFCRLFEDKGAAQKKGTANGKAQPFLTSGGEAVPKENRAKKTKSITDPGAKATVRYRKEHVGNKRRMSSVPSLRCSLCI